MIKTGPINILLADDHPVLRRGLRTLIEEHADFIVVAEADDGEKALSILDEKQIDVAIVDFDMPNVSGLEVVDRTLSRGTSVEFIMLTMHKDESIFNRALDLGVRGFILKDNAVNDILNCVKEVAAGGYFISSSISGFLLRRQTRTVIQRVERNLADHLTETERTILKLLSEMKTSKEIAGELFISTKTVENHRANITRKLGLQGYQALLKFAVDHKTEL